MIADAPSSAGIPSGCVDREVRSIHVFPYDVGRYVDAGEAVAVFVLQQTDAAMEDDDFLEPFTEEVFLQ